MSKFGFLKEAEIEYLAEDIRYTYGQRFGEIKEPPVPIEEIVEFHLGLTLEPFEKDRDILGFLDIERKAIGINESIFPNDDADAKSGRYRFTLAHEAAHWIIHAPVL